MNKIIHHIHHTYITLLNNHQIKPSFNGVVQGHSYLSSPNTRQPVSNNSISSYHKYKHAA